MSKKDAMTCIAYRSRQGRLRLFPPSIFVLVTRSTIIDRQDFDDINTSLPFLNNLDFDYMDLARWSSFDIERLVDVLIQDEGQLSKSDQTNMN